MGVDAVVVVVIVVVVAVVMVVVDEVREASSFWSKGWQAGRGR